MGCGALSCQGLETVIDPAPAPPRTFDLKIGWTSDFYDWNEVMVWAVDQFGLPGERYETKVTMEHMLFRFSQPQDYVWMKLRWG